MLADVAAARDLPRFRFATLAQHGNAPLGIVVMLNCVNVSDAAVCVNGVDSGGGVDNALPTCCHWRRPALTARGGVRGLKDWVMRRVLPPSFELTVNSYNALRGLAFTRDTSMAVLCVASQKLHLLFSHHVPPFYICCYCKGIESALVLERVEDRCLFLLASSEHYILSASMSLHRSNF